MNGKVIIGISIAAILVIGIGLAVGSSSILDEETSTSVEETSSESNSEGKQFSLELSDSVTAVGP